MAGIEPGPGSWTDKEGRVHYDAQQEVTKMSTCETCKGTFKSHDGYAPMICLKCQNPSDFNKRSYVCGICKKTFALEPDEPLGDPEDIKKYGPRICMKCDKLRDLLGPLYWTKNKPRTWGRYLYYPGYTIIRGVPIIKVVQIYAGDAVPQADWWYGPLPEVPTDLHKEVPK